MKKVNLYFALLLSVFIGFSSCSEDDELTPEELELKQTEELVETITSNFDDIVSKQWAYKEFQASDAMVAAAQTDDGYVAATRIADAEYATNFNMVISFVVDGDSLKPQVAMNVEESELEPLVLGYLSALYGFEMTELWDAKEGYLAQFRRVIASPFAADDLSIDDITNDVTGLCVFKIKMNDFSGLSYDDLVLSQKQLIADNNDKIYINADGTLTVETTSTEYGISKLILEEVTE